MKITHLLLIFALIVASALIAGCGETLVAKDGDTVSVHYTLTLEDGTEKETSKGGEPLSFTVGAGDMITGFDNAVLGMKVGEIKTVTLPPEEAYGYPSDDLIFEVNRDIFEDLELYKGQQLPMQNTQTGQSFWVTVISFDEETVTIDANNELAGKTLTFEIELVEIETAE
jgi:peptidylprolyl isomerase